MNKMIFTLATTFLIAFSAQATQTQKLKSMTSPTAEAFLKQAEKNSKGNRFAAAASYKIVSVTPARGNESQEQADERVLKSILHRDYSITGDDGGYSVESLKGSDNSKLLVDFASAHNADDDDISEINNTLVEAARLGLSVYLVDGSGNNTSAAIWAVIDHKHNELAYYIESNFGSDD